MKGIWFEVESCQLRCRYFDSGWIGYLCESGLDREPRSGPGVGNQIDDRLIADQRSCLPGLRDEGEHAVFDLIPLAASRREMRRVKVEAGKISQTLQPCLPQSRPAGIAAPRIGHDQQFRRLGVNLAPHVLPPGQDAVDGKLGRVVIDAHAHPALIASHVVDPIKNCLAQFFVGEIMDQGLLRFSLPMALLAAMAVVSH